MVVLLLTVSIICSLSPNVFARFAHRRDGAERRSKTQVMPRIVDLIKYPCQHLIKYLQ